MNYTHFIYYIVFYITTGLMFNGILFNNVALAQVEADQTLTVPTKVNLSGNTFEIKDGTSTGQNLFHSFKSFSIPEGNNANFINNNPSIQNIFARITGKSESNIYGKIQSGGESPHFNLFLMNSNGIVFGSQSSLDLKGSFVATTANSILFGDKALFDTSGSFNEDQISLLTVNPSAFFFDQLRNQPISYKSNSETAVGLAVSNGNSILLVGGNIELDSGILSAENGRIELGGLAEKGTVNLNISGEKLNLDFPEAAIFADVMITNGSLIDVRNKGSGSIAINAKDIDILHGSLILSGISIGLSSDTPNPGKILINAIKSVNVDDRSAVASISFGSGNTGDVIFNADSLTLTNVSEISSRIFGREGNSGNVLLNVTNGIIISGSEEGIAPAVSSVASASNKIGNSGNIRINASWLSLSDGASIRNSVLGKGTTGDIVIHTDNFIVVENSKQNSTTEIRTVIESGAVSNGGNINIHTRSLSLIGGGQLASSVSPGGQGIGGNIDINALDSVIISGIGLDGFVSGIFADSELGARGTSGNISINTDFLKISDGAEVKVSNPQGKAGTLTINANFLNLYNGKIIAETSGNNAENSANIDLKISDILRIENESLISAKATSQANGGNIRIDAPILLALSSTGSEGSDIKANAESGAGGNIKIKSQGIFGIQERKASSGNKTNDIDASSQFGQSGQVQINTTTDPSQGLVELPATVIDPSTLVAQNPCKRASSSEFTRSGRGGLPPSLSQDLNGESIQVGLVEPVNISAEKPEPKSDPKPVSSLAQSSSQIAPAQGWVYNNKGEVVLVAYNSAVTGSQRLQSVPKGCPVF